MTGRASDDGTVLKSLLRQRHIQSHPDFRRAYDRLAREVEPELMGTAPAKAQFYRWLSGDIQGLPRGQYCRILEAMFPGHTAEELFTRTSVAARETAARLDGKPEQREMVSASGESASADTAHPSEAPGSSTVSADRMNARMRALMSWVDQNSPLKERDIHPDPYRSYSRGRGVERSR